MELLNQNLPTYASRCRHFLEKIFYEAFIKVPERENYTDTFSSSRKFTASYSLVLIAVVVNFIGVFLCTIYKKQHHRQLVMSRDDLLKLPLLLSCSLFGVFLVLNLISLEYITLAINIYTLMYGFFSLGRVLGITTTYLWPQKLYSNRSFRVSLAEGDSEHLAFSFAFSDILAHFVAGVIVVAYYLKKHWILNNVVAASFCFTLLDSLTLDRYWYSIILFVGLFLYDVFWVFGSNVMVSVAKNINAPLMFRFPYGAFGVDGKRRYAGLGLGDVAVPGLFLAFLLRFDMRKGKVDYHHFISGMFCYTVSLMLCNIVVDYTGRGQPAFFYIVPLFLAGSLATAVLKGDTSDIFSYVVEAEDSESNTKQKSD